MKVVFYTEVGYTGNSVMPLSSRLAGIASGQTLYIIICTVYLSIGIMSTLTIMISSYLCTLSN